MSSLVKSLPQQSTSAGIMSPQNPDTKNEKFFSQPFTTTSSLRHSSSLPKPPDPAEGHNVFKSRLTINNKVCDFIIDNDSEGNMISLRLVKALGLPTYDHPCPYKLGWISDKSDLSVHQQCIFTFSVGSYYRDSLCCDVVDMENCHLILGQPWILDVDAVCRSRNNTYEFVWHTKLVILVPLEENPTSTREKHEVTAPPKIFEPDINNNIIKFKKRKKKNNKGIVLSNPPSNIISDSCDIIIDGDVVVPEILTRLPVKSLTRFKTVCTHWNSMVQKDRNFIDFPLPPNVKMKKNRFKFKKKNNRSGHVFPNPLIQEDLVVHEILSRLPAKSLFRFKSICKQWDCIIGKDQNFIDLHLTRSTSRNHSLLILTPPPKEKNSSCKEMMFLTGNMIEGCIEEGRTTRSLVQFNGTKNPMTLCYNILTNSINGLICSIDILAPDITPYLCNLSTREVSPLVKSTLLKEEMEKYGDDVDISSWNYQFGFDPASNEYILVFFPIMYDTSVGNLYNFCEVLTVIPKRSPGFLFILTNIYKPLKLSPVEMWEDLIQDGGVDFTDTYVFWNKHEEAPGNYYFDGRYDIVRFIKTIQQPGLLAPLIIGPYVCGHGDEFKTVFETILTTNNDSFVVFHNCKRIEKLEDDNHLYRTLFLRSFSIPRLFSSKEEVHTALVIDTLILSTRNKVDYVLHGDTRFIDFLPTKKNVVFMVSLIKLKDKKQLFKKDMVFSLILFKDDGRWYFQVVIKRSKFIYVHDGSTTFNIFPRTKTVIIVVSFIKLKDDGRCRNLLDFYAPLLFFRVSWNHRIQILFGDMVLICLQRIFSTCRAKWELRIALVKSLYMVPPHLPPEFNISSTFNISDIFPYHPDDPIYDNSGTSSASVGEYDGDHPANGPLGQDTLEPNG